MHSLTYGQLLKGNRNFRNLLAGQVISELGNWFNFIAGLGLVRVVSEASPVAAGIFFVCRFFAFQTSIPKIKPLELLCTQFNYCSAFGP